MPFKSKKQMRWMYWKYPEMAKKWSEHTPDIKGLPESLDTAYKRRKRKKK